MSGRTLTAEEISFLRAELAASQARVRELEDQILEIRKSVQQEYKHVSSSPYSLSGSAYLNSIERIRTALDPNWRTDDIKALLDDIKALKEAGK